MRILRVTFLAKLAVVMTCGFAGAAGEASQEFKFDLNPRLPAHYFRVSADAFGFPREIVVRNEKNPAPLQTIAVAEDDKGCEPTLDARTLVSADYNFDGYADIALSCYRGATGNEGYLIWLFSPATATFIREPSKEIFEHPEPDRARKLLRTRGSAGAAGIINYRQAFAFTKGRFLLVEEETQDQNEDGTFTLTVRKRVKGAMKEISRKKLSVNEALAQKR